jgi:hypothetical protein
MEASNGESDIGLCGSFDRAGPDRLSGHWQRASHRFDSNLGRAGYGPFGLLAMDKRERKRKLFMHINVTIGLLAYLGVMVEIVRNMATSKDLNTAALVAKTSMAWLLLIYIVLCVRSFRAARRSGKV